MSSTRSCRFFSSASLFVSVELNNSAFFNARSIRGVENGGGYLLTVVLLFKAPQGGSEHGPPVLEDLAVEPKTHLVLLNIADVACKHLLQTGRLKEYETRYEQFSQNCLD